MKLMKTEDAVGQVLCHDVTQIIPGVFKGPVFRKGHIIREEDIPVLLDVGKENIYIWEMDEGMMHENEAAEVLYDICRGGHMHQGKISEGKIEAIADIDGLLKVDKKRLNIVNSQGEMMIAARHGNFPVKAGDKLAGMRIIPLVIERAKMGKAQREAGGAILNVLPFTAKRVGIVTTGNEIYNHRIEDKFTPVVVQKVEEYGGIVIGQRFSGDDVDIETGFIHELLEAGADLVLCTGGMSVDPDDRTPMAIRTAADRVVSYGAPVLPGAMFMLAYKGNVPIVGLPGCVMYAKRTIFDLILPRLMANDPVTSDEIASLGEGGLCLGCKVCVFPNCGFGK